MTTTAVGVLMAEDWNKTATLQNNLLNIGYF